MSVFYSNIIDNHLFCECLSTWIFFVFFFFPFLYGGRRFCANFSYFESWSNSVASKFLKSTYKLERVDSFFDITMKITYMTWLTFKTSLPTTNDSLGHPSEPWVCLILTLSTTTFWWEIMPPFCQSSLNPMIYIS